LRGLPAALEGFASARDDGNLEGDPREVPMRAIAIFFAGLLVLSSLALADPKKDWDDCAGDDIEKSLAGCSAIIARGKDSKVNLALAYGDRGKAYVDKGDYDRAIADLDEALRINPKAPTIGAGRSPCPAKRGGEGLAKSLKFIYLSAGRGEGNDRP
jgi:tetratricopeptide (TPR) repeat protein